MDGELSALLTANNVHKDVMDWLAHADQGCTSLKNFANFIDAKSEVQDAILEHCTAHKASGTQTNPDWVSTSDSD